MKGKIKFIFGFLLFVIVLPAIGHAQDKVMAEVIRSSERIVRGAPFSAEAISESVQSLADGNKITNRSTTRMYRDSEGRFRRDDMPNPGGILGAVVEISQTLFIIDPVEGVKFYLDTAKKTVRQSAIKPDIKFDYEYRQTIESKKKKEIETEKIKNIENESTSENESSSESESSSENETNGKKIKPTTDQISEERKQLEKFEKEKTIGKGPERTKEGSKQAQISAKRAEISAKQADLHAREAAKKGSIQWVPNPISPDATKTESLGVRNIEGLEATGTRTITTIAAGTIGNERAIDITYERWYSKDLQLIVLSKHSDPRFGEQTYRLTNINRHEPARSLFALPADYKILNPFPPKPVRPPNMPKPAAPKEKPE